MPADAQPALLERQSAIPEHCACGNTLHWHKVYIEPWQRPFSWVWACSWCQRRTTRGGVAP